MFCIFFVAGLVAFVVATVNHGGAIFSLISMLFYPAYFTWLHGSASGQTIGNKICNIRLISGVQGGRVSYTHAFGRWLISLVSAIPLGLGYLWMLRNDQNQTWHDKAAGTYVVKTASYPSPQRPRLLRSRRT